MTGFESAVMTAVAELDQRARELSALVDASIAERDRLEDRVAELLALLEAARVKLADALARPT